MTLLLKCSAEHEIGGKWQHFYSAHLPRPLSTRDCDQGDSHDRPDQSVDEIHDLVGEPPETPLRRGSDEALHCRRSESRKSH